MGKKIDFGFPRVKNLSQSPRFHVFGVHFDQNLRAVVFFTFIFITIFNAFLCFYIAEELISRFLGTYIDGGLLIPTIFSLSGTSMVS